MLLFVFFISDIEFIFSIRSVHLSYNLINFQHSVELMTFCMSYFNISTRTYRSMNLKMSYELHRLYSFDNSLWKLLPGKHSASCLARMGFYYSGNQAVIICYKCLCHIDCSELSESPSVKHSQLSPGCLLVVGTAADNVLLVHPEEVIKKFSAEAILWDTADKTAVQTVAISLQSSTVEVSLFKKAYTIFVQAYERSQKRGVFPSVDADITQFHHSNPDVVSVHNDISPIDRNNPDFDRLRYDSGIFYISATFSAFFVFNNWPSVVCTGILYPA